MATRRPVELEVMYGTLELLILKALTWGPRHGLGVMLWLTEATNNRLNIEEGALYPALHRMEQRGWLDAEWGPSDKGRQAKFYKLTAAGRAALAAQHARWDDYTAMMSLVLKARSA